MPKFGGVVAGRVQNVANNAGPKPTVEVINPTGGDGVVLVCEHASNFVPPEFDALGVSEEVLRSHVAWDPGALAVARGLAEALGQPLVAQSVSRLVYDCNRPPSAPGAMPERSEKYDIPGNKGLTAGERERRTRAYYLPFCETLAEVIKARLGGKSRPAIITIHSFTPIYMDRVRTVEIGILHDTDTRLADFMLDSMQREKAFNVQRNAPYGPEDGVTHTLAEHALPFGLFNVMIEIRNDLIATRAMQVKITRWLSRHISDALEALAERSPIEGTAP